MLLKGYSSEAIRHIRHQACDHILFGEDFYDNLDNVLNFQEGNSFPVVRPDILFSYLQLYEIEQAFYPWVSQNVEEYINYAWENYSQESGLNVVLYFNFLNRIKKISQKNKGNFTNDYLYSRYYTSSFKDNILRILYTNSVLDGNAEFKNNIRKSIVQNFSITAQLLSDSLFTELILSDNEEFLNYVNLLMRDYPELLLTKDFLKRVSLILQYNEFHSFDIKKENKIVVRKLKRFTNEHIVI